MNWPNRLERTRFFRFLIVGVTNTVAMYLLYLLLRYLGMQYLVALTADYALGICFGYILNRHWTFSAQGKPRHSFIKYSTSYILVYLLNLVLLFVLVAAVDLNDRIAQIPALAIATIASYGFQRYWVFRSE